MISTLASVRPLAQAAAAPRAAAPVACEPPTSDPDLLDFSRIDCPAKAAMLPILEPAAQLGIVAGIMFSVMISAQSGAVPLVSVDVASKCADKLMNLSYGIDLKNAETPLTGTGTVDGRDADMALALATDGQGATLSERIGDARSALTLAVDQQSQQLQASGKMGDVDVALRFSPIKGDGGSDDFKGFHVEGTLGGQAYTVDNLFDAKKAMGGEASVMTSRGKLGDGDITKDYKISAAQAPTGVELNIVGAGTTLGVPQDVQVKMTLTA